MRGDQEIFSWHIPSFLSIQQVTLTVWWVLVVQACRCLKGLKWIWQSPGDPLLLGFLVGCDCKCTVSWSDGASPALCCENVRGGNRYSLIVWSTPLRRAEPACTQSPPPLFKRCCAAWDIVGKKVGGPLSTGQIIIWWKQCLVWVKLSEILLYCRVCLGLLNPLIAPLLNHTAGEQRLLQWQFPLSYAIRSSKKMSYFFLVVLSSWAVLLFWSKMVCVAVCRLELNAADWNLNCDLAAANCESAAQLPVKLLSSHSRSLFVSWFVPSTILSVLVVVISEVRSSLLLSYHMFWTYFSVHKKCFFAIFHQIFQFSVMLQF